jgi:2-haloacid dehalogenase
MTLTLHIGASPRLARRMARALHITIALAVLAAGASAEGAPSKPRFKAVAFDYFVLFDPNSVVPDIEKVLPGKGADFARAWRSKQFEYGFLRSITRRYRDFFAVTADALDYTAEAMHVQLTAEQRARLLQAYLRLTPWPDTVAALKRLRAAGVHIVTIANFSTKMLRANAEHAGIVDLFDDLLSTEVNGTYKPDRAAYALGMRRLGLRKSEITFAAFGGWDAYGGKNFGYTTYWVNRFGLPPERLGLPPDGTGRDLEGFVAFVLGGP